MQSEPSPQQRPPHSCPLPAQHTRPSRHCSPGWHTSAPQRDAPNGKHWLPMQVSSARQQRAPQHVCPAAQQSFSPHWFAILQQRSLPKQISSALQHFCSDAGPHSCSWSQDASQLYERASRQ